MVGLKTIAALAGLSCILVGVANAAPADAPFGKSAALGIAFSVESDSNQWCRPAIRIRLDAKNPAPIINNTAEYQQMIGRIRGIVQNQCRTARSVTYIATVRGQDVASGETSEFTGWRYVILTTQDQARTCSGPSNAALCEQRWQVYDRLRSLFIQDGFSQVRATRFLSTEHGADVEFVSEAATGKALFFPIAGTLNADVAGELLGSQIALTQRQCDGPSSVSERTNLRFGFVNQDITCIAASGKSQRTYFFVGTATAGLYVIVFSDFTRDAASGRSLRSAFGAALGEAGATVNSWDRVVEDSFVDLQMTSFATSPCNSELVSFAKMAERPVAVRLRPILGESSSDLVLKVYEGKTPAAPEDAWSMRIGGLGDVERKMLQVRAAQGAWLVFKAGPESFPKSFSNQIFVTDGATACGPLGGEQTVSVANMPKRATELYAKALRLHVEANPQAVRQALSNWAATGDLGPSQQMLFYDRP